MKFSIILITLALTAAGCDSVARTTPDGNNTVINERDHGDSTKTPLDQNKNQ